MGCHDETFKNFRKSKKKIGDLHELDNLKQELFFKIEIANVIFRTIFNKSKILKVAFNCQSPCQQLCPRAYFFKMTPQQVKFTTISGKIDKIINNRF